MSDNTEQPNLEEDIKYLSNSPQFARFIKDMYDEREYLLNNLNIDPEVSIETKVGELNHLQKRLALVDYVELFKRHGLF